MIDPTKPAIRLLEEAVDQRGRENLAKILRRTREINNENIAKALEAGDIEKTLRIASNEAKVEIYMRRKGVDI
jgi:hypothetical protein